MIDSDRAEGHRFEERNFADIVYEYSVAGRKLRNNRVSIGEDLGNFQVAETIAKYPVGTVVTVYYNPLHPDQAVLERDLPKGMWGCLGIGTAIVLAIVFGSAIGLHAITEFVTTRIPQQGNAAAAVAFGAFGTVIALFALALHRQASLAMKWPVVTGTIKLVRHRAVPCRAAGRRFGARQIMYQRKVSYTYQYNNLTYTNTHATLGEQRRLHLELAGAQIHHRLQGRRQREGLGQSRQSVAGHAGAARGLRVGVMAVSRGDLGRGVLRGGAWLRFVGWAEER